MICGTVAGENSILFGFYSTEPLLLFAWPGSYIKWSQLWDLLSYSSTPSKPVRLTISVFAAFGMILNLVGNCYLFQQLCNALFIFCLFSVHICRWTLALVMLYFAVCQALSYYFILDKVMGKKKSPEEKNSRFCD